MKNYFLSHWRGEHGLMRSCIINGFLLYWLLAIILAAICVLIAAIFLAVLGTARFQNEIDKELLVHYFVVGGIPFCIAFCIWQVVGLVRCGNRYLTSTTNDVARRVGGAIALLWAASITIFVVKVMIDFVHGKF